MGSNRMQKWYTAINIHEQNIEINNERQRFTRTWMMLFYDKNNYKNTYKIDSFRWKIYLDLNGA